MIKTWDIFSSSLLFTLLVSCSPQNQTNVSSSVPSQAVTVINLTQTGCQFLETEAQDYQYEPKQSSQCKEINAQTLSERKKRSSNL